MKKARRCGCGCGLPTGGSKFKPGHGTRVVGHHWVDKEESRIPTMVKLMERRRATAYRLLETGVRTHDFSDDYFALYNIVKSVHQGAELEVIVQTEHSVCAIDVGVPTLKVGFEWDPGNRYALGTASKSERDQELSELGWTLIHLKTLPSPTEVALVLSLTGSTNGTTDEGAQPAA